MTYSAGIIGAGGVAGMGLLGTHDVGAEKVRASHAGGYAEADDIELVAVSDIDDEKLSAFGDAWELPPDRRYESHEAMLTTEDLDVVSVATPTFLHDQHVLDAARIGDPGVIWCEKPIASSVADAEEMVETCDDADIELVINHTFRFTEKVRRLRELLGGTDFIGDVRTADARFRMELMRNSTHLLDTLVYLLDTRPAQVAGFLTGDNEAMDALEADAPVDDSGGGGFVVMDDGTFVTVDCTAPRELSSMQYTFIGTDGKLYLNNDDGEWRYWQLEDGDHVEEPIPGIDGAWTWDDDYERGFPNAAYHLVDLLDGHADNRSSGRAAIRSLEIIVGFYVSHYTESRVDLPLERPLRDVTIRSW